MSYIIIIAIAIIAIILFLNYSNKLDSTKFVNELRKDWGRPKEEYFHFDRIERFSRIVPVHPFHKLSEQTIFDIDFYNLFIFLDRTISRVGQQYLFRTLLNPHASVESLKKFDSFVIFFSEHEDIRLEVQQALSKLAHDDAYTIALLLKDKSVEKPRWFSWLPVSLGVMLVMLVLSFAYPVLLLFAIIPAAINSIVHYWNKGNTFQFSKSIPQLNALSSAAGRISKVSEVFKNPSVEESLSEIRILQQKTNLISFGNGQGAPGELGQIGSYFVELIKGFFLIEVFATFSVVKQLHHQRQSVVALFNYVGEIDTAIAVASVRSGGLATCQPEFKSNSKSLHSKNIFHPLIKDSVKNDITLNGKSVLITGSNMSGKTTFLRTLVINSVLAQTIYTCFADEFSMPLVKQFSSIRIDDNLMEAKSYFLEEVSVVSTLLKEAGTRTQNLFVLDEVFKGTNTIERVAAAKAILSYLNREDNIVIVSTHDIELVRLLREDFDFYHFTDSIQDGKLHFDHKLKPGPLTMGNAIRILELSNFPMEVITEANRLSKNLSGQF